jgi:ABC-2 type transport system permease protein
MSRILRVAAREFAATAITKGFIIGALVVPAVFAACIPLVIFLTMQADAPVVQGKVAVIDRSGVVAERLESRLSPEGIAQARGEDIAKILEGIGLPPEAGIDRGQMATQAGLPSLTLETLPLDADEETEQAVLRDAAPDGPDRRLALAVIDQTAVLKPDGDPDFGAYQLFTRTKIDDRIIDDINRGLRNAVRDARYEAAGFDRATIDALTAVRAAPTQEVTEAGVRQSTSDLGQFLPFIFMFLLILGVMVGGQYLLTTTIEEKSSRVVEVLLSAVSPMQLMAGKILGQLGVGLSLLAIYNALGIATLIAFGVADVISPLTIVYLFVFFLLAYFMIASLLAAVGSAVNDLREAQSLSTPVMIAVSAPYILWLPISRDPNSTLATVLSFVPPVSPFVMMMRVSSTEPPPVWQIIAAIAVGAVGAYACIWFAAKVFRVGLLMYGKPPNLATLIKWVRMA